MSNNTPPSVKLRFLGGFELATGAGAQLTVATDKGRALLAYLALEPRPHRREVLAGMFWPEHLEAKALANLRLTLHRLRQSLGQLADDSGELLRVTRQTVQLSPAALDADAVQFQLLLAESAAHAHLDLLHCERCLTTLTQAADHYHGELLAGFGLGDAPGFEEWLLLRREAFHQQALMTFQTLASASEQRGNDHQAHLYASRQLTIEPSREHAHRQIMRVLARRGHIAEAIAQYHLCRRLLHEGLGAEPDDETIALYEQIRAGRFTKDAYTPPLAQPTNPVARGPQAWDDAPQIVQLYGRKHELAELERRLAQEHYRLIALVGMGGVGKTTLAAAAVEAVGPEFDLVIWRSLLNAPPLDDLLRDLLQALATERLVEMPTQLDAQLALLLNGLRQRRCLLVLDNLESILEASQPGRMRADYGGYAQLIQYVAERRHQSCLLLTSRERPQAMARWDHDASFVYTLPLSGLDLAAGRAMLTARGLASSIGETSMLVERYSGNPLALKLVAQTVQDLFGSDIASFLATEAPIFDDIRSVLDQQFTRLSPLEQQLLIWLAIEREPVSVQVLRNDLLAAGSPRIVLEAIRGLRQRSLIEQTAQGCTLQNVVTEYLTDVLIDQICAELLDTAGPSQRAPLPALALQRYALIKATAKEYVRASQERLILQPIAQRALASLGSLRLIEQLKRLIASLRDEQQATPGYAAGNILNLLLHLRTDMHGFDFSQLNVRHAYLQGALLPGVNFRDADFADAVFTNVFGEILAIRFDAWGQLLIAGQTSAGLCVWRADDGQLLREYQSFGAGAQSAVFSSDGQLLASSNTDHQVRIWDVHGQLLHHLTGHTAAPWSLMFSPDAQLLATGGPDGAVQLWDAHSGQLRQTWRGHNKPVVALAFTSDATLLASGDVDGVICVWRRDHAEPLHTLRGHSEEVHALVFGANDTRLASGSHDRTIRLWDVRIGQAVHILQAHTQMVRELAISADGQTLASGGHDTFVCLWDIQSGQSLRTLLGSTYATTHLSFSNSADPVLATVSADHTVHLWQIATGQRLDTLQSFNNHIYAVDVSHDGTLVASGGADGSICLWQLNTGQLVQLLRGHSRSVYSIAFNPNGSMLASAGRETSIRLWDIATGQTIRVLTGHSDDVEALQFSPDGARLISASRDGTLRLWDATTGQPLRILRGHTDQVRACALGPGGNLLVSGGHDRTVRLWDVRSAAPRLLHTLHGHSNSVKAVAFSQDGRLVASGGFDQTVRIWDVTQAEALVSLPTPAASIFSLAFHPNGELLAIGSANHSVQLWEITPVAGQLAVPRLRQTLLGHTDLVEAVRFSPDGQWLISGSADETIRVWEVATGACPIIWRAEGPYAGMNIAGVTGLSAAQKTALKALGAVEV